jgi:hypothetical protein
MPVLILDMKKAAGLKGAKVGDILSSKISKIDGNKIELDYATLKVEPSNVPTKPTIEDMAKMKAEMDVMSPAMLEKHIRKMQKA